MPLGVVNIRLIKELTKSYYHNPIENTNHSHSYFYFKKFNELKAVTSFLRHKSELNSPIATIVTVYGI